MEKEKMLGLISKGGGYGRGAMVPQGMGMEKFRRRC